MLPNQAPAIKVAHSSAGFHPIRSFKIRWLIRRMLKCEGGDDRTTFAESLARIGKPVVPALIKILEAKKDVFAAANIRAAIEILGGIGPEAKESVPALIVKLLEYEDSYDSHIIRSEAARALDKIGWKPTTQELSIAYLLAEERWDDLEKIGYPAVPTLIKALGCDHINKRAALALLTIDHPQIKSLRGYIAGMHNHDSYTLSSHNINLILEYLEKGREVEVQTYIEAEYYTRDYHDRYMKRNAVLVIKPLIAFPQIPVVDWNGVKP